MLIDEKFDNWKSEVNKWLSMDKKCYREKTTSFMKHIEEEFSPRKAAEKILEIISD